MTHPEHVKTFEEMTQLIESHGADDRDEALDAAAGLWIGFPLWCEAIECHPEYADGQKRDLRSRLFLVHSAAVQRLMAEAELAGLNPAPLAEEGRVCRELYDPVKLDPSRHVLFGVRWFHHPIRTSDYWPDCLGEWRYTLPPAVQEAIRQGEEVFCRLSVRLDVKVAVPLILDHKPNAKKVGNPGVRTGVANVYGMIHRLSDTAGTKGEAGILLALKRAENKDLMASVQALIREKPTTKTGRRKEPEDVIAAAMAQYKPAEK